MTQRVPHCKNCNYYVHGKWGNDIKYSHWCLHFNRRRKTHLLTSEIKTSPNDCPIRELLGLSKKVTEQEKVDKTFAMPEKERRKYVKNKLEYWRNKNV